MIARNIKRGFTLIEILIVVVILGVLAALVVPSVTSALGDAKNEAADARGSQILTMITRYNQFLPGGGTAISTTDGAIAAASFTKLTAAGYCTAADVENQLDDFFNNILHVSFLKVNFGRLEIETYIVTKYQNVILNSEKKRKLDLENFEW